MLAAFEGNPFPCGETSLAAFDINTYSYTRWRWRHFRLTLYPCGGMALAAFETNTSTGWTALATFEAFGLVWFDA